jgi:peroxiredoxin
MNAHRLNYITVIRPEGAAMLAHRTVLHLFVAVLIAASVSLRTTADNFRNVNRGEPFPAFKLPAIDGSIVDSESMKGSVVVLLCLSAEQRRSELAAMDSDAVVLDLASESVKVVHVTADVIQKAYFEKFRQERGIRAPLALDAERMLYGKLGLIVFPTTAVIGKDGKLANVIALHDNRYKHVLDAEVRHALGQMSDEELAKRLAEQPTSDSSPKSASSAHRALARSLREKGRLDAAKDELKKALELDPQNAEIMLDMAELALSSRDLDGADASVQKVLTIQADHRRARQLMGMILFHRGKLDEAAAELDAALKLNPNPELVHYYLGRIHEQRGETGKALEHYREALRRFVHEPGETPAPAR